MTSASTFNRTLAGVRVRCTHPHAKWLTYDRAIAVVVKALKSVPHLDEHGVIEFRYTSSVKGTDPYRRIRFRPHWTPGQWLEIVDVPASKSAGFITVEFPNHHLFPEAAKLHTNKDSGALYEVEKPDGWK